MTSPIDASVRAPQAADWALARGISSMTTDDLGTLLAVSVDQVRVRLHAPVQRGEWVQPSRGLWMPVPPEYRLWGAPPGIDVIDSLAKHLAVDYYVGWLSAAALHGAAHQSPQVFQAATSRLLRDRVVGRTRFEFHTRAVDRIPVVTVATRSGQARVSSVASTMLDIAAAPSLAGGVDNAATVLVELAESHASATAEMLALTASFRPSAFRRLGWILDHFGDAAAIGPLDQLRAVAVAGPPTAARLDPTRDLTGPLDERWLVRVNRDVEPDL